MSDEKKPRRCTVEGCGGTMKPTSSTTGGWEVGHQKDTKLPGAESVAVWKCDKDPNHVEEGLRNSWRRKHSNGLFGRAEKISEIGDRYVAAAARSGEFVLGSDHATLELAKARSDADVQATGHQCSADCEPWHER